MRRLLPRCAHRPDLLPLNRDGRLSSLVFPIGIGLGDALALPTRGKGLPAEPTDPARCRIPGSHAITPRMGHDRITEVTNVRQRKAIISAAFAVMPVAPVGWHGPGAWPSAPVSGRIVSGRRPRHGIPWPVLAPDTARVPTAIGFGLAGEGTQDAPNLRNQR
jgi:hypothetical protein